MGLGPMGLLFWVWVLARVIISGICGRESLKICVFGRIVFCCWVLVGFFGLLWFVSWGFVLSWLGQGLMGFLLCWFGLSWNELGVWSGLLLCVCKDLCWKWCFLCYWGLKLGLFGLLGIVVPWWSGF